MLGLVDLALQHLVQSLDLLRLDKYPVFILGDFPSVLFDLSLVLVQLVLQTGEVLLVGCDLPVDLQVEFLGEGDL